MRTPACARFEYIRPQSGQQQTGFADIALEPSEIADELTHISSMIANGTVGMTSEELLTKIYSILKKISNVNYTN